MKIFMIGFLGSEKDTFGQKLATKFDYQFIDLDIYIEEKYQMKIKDIFMSKGEPYYRTIELASLKELMQIENCVISTGATTPCFEDNMELMNRAGVTIYIRQGTNCLYNKLVHSKKYREYIENMSHFQLVEYLETSMEKRKAFYEQAKYNILGKGLRTRTLEGIIKKELSEQKNH